jgi:hypothetical protein
MRPPLRLGRSGGAVLLGGASTITALLISGYWAMGLGALGLPLAFAARSRSHATGRTGLATTAVVLNILGLALGLSAQLMKLFVMSRS